MAKFSANVNVDDHGAIEKVEHTASDLADGLRSGGADAARAVRGAARTTTGTLRTASDGTLCMIALGAAVLGVGLYAAGQRRLAVVGAAVAAGVVVAVLAARSCDRKGWRAMR